MKIACLLGPTASGKTAAALDLARRAASRGEAVEIISMDSALVFRQMDIGTAKPSAKERALVPHHLIDIRDPLNVYSAAEFRDDTLRLIDEIRARGAYPLLVGGTMLYFKALTAGLADLPAANAAVRAELDAQAAAEGWPALHSRLAIHDPVTAARLAPNDSQRIQRALEIWMLTGKSLSEWIKDQAARTKTQADTQAELGAASAETAAAEPEFVPISLEPSDRSVLHARIEARFDTMLANGLIEEVAQLRARGDLDPALPSMRCVGYRQVWDYLDGRDDRQTMRDKGVFATRQLCKRQLTWLRSMPSRQIVDCAAPHVVSHAVAAVETIWRRPS